MSIYFNVSSEWKPECCPGGCSGSVLCSAALRNIQSGGRRRLPSLLSVLYSPPLGGGWGEVWDHQPTNITREHINYKLLMWWVSSFEKVCACCDCSLIPVFLYNFPFIIKILRLVSVRLWELRPRDQCGGLLLCHQPGPGCCCLATSWRWSVQFSAGLTSDNTHRGRN